LTSDCYTEASMMSWKLPNIPTDSSFKYLISTAVILQQFEDISSFILNHIIL